MVFKNFRINVIIRIVLLTITLAILTYFVMNDILYTSVIFISVLLVYQVYSLIKYIDKTNKKIARFFEAIKYSDFSQSFSDDTSGESFKQLSDSMTDVIAKFQNERIVKESHSRYLQTIVQHIATGLLSFQPDGDIKLVNNAAKKLLGLYGIRNLHDLNKNNENFVKTLLELKPGEKRLVKYVLNNEEIQLTVFATQFNLFDQKYILVSMQNIGQELEEHELEAWLKLIRVLTHEIMNSVTPISSLASTISDLLQETETKIMQESDQIADIQNALQTIKKRSQGLLSFVDTYRSLTRLPKPNFEIFKIEELFGRITQLMSPKVQESNIQFMANVTPESLEITADPDMIEQVLINLLINAIHAINEKKDGRINLNGFMNKQGRIIIEVSDNGAGIPEDVVDKIFIPFFTTKKEGSGIGLSLSRQIMLKHKGTISVQSVLQEKTTFSLKF